VVTIFSSGVIWCLSDIDIQYGSGSTDEVGETEHGLIISMRFNKPQTPVRLQSCICDYLALVKMFSYRNHHRERERVYKF